MRCPFVCMVASLHRCTQVGLAYRAAVVNVRIDKEKHMNIWKRIVVILLVSFCCIGCDQSSKHIASEHLAKNTMTSYFSDTVRIGYTENRGAFLGMGKDLPEELRFVVFTVFVGIFLTSFLLYLVFSSPLNMYTLVGLSCLFSGGASNFVDRAMNNGAVREFLMWLIWQYLLGLHCSCLVVITTIPTKKMPNRQLKSTSLAL